MFDDIVFSDFSTDNTIKCKSLDNLHKFLKDPLKSKLNSNGLTLLHFNIRSVRANFDELVIFLNNCSFIFDVIVLTEIWIDESEVSLYNLDNYNCHSYCRDENRSGGVLIYVFETLDFAECYNWSLSSAEGIVVNSKSLNLCIVALYRSHSFSIEFFNKEFSSLIENIKFKNVLFVCDLNIDLLKNNNNMNNYLDILNSNGFKSYVNLPTRVTLTTKTRIDHLFFKTKSNFSIETAILDFSRVATGDYFGPHYF